MRVIDTDQLERDGFVILRGLVRDEEIAEFESSITRFSEAQLEKLGLPRRAAEPFIDLFTRGGQYTKRIYKLLEELFVLHRMSVRIGEELRTAGFLDWAKIDVPLIWPDIRADIPNDTVRSFPVHQDIASTQCGKAWRMWVALRPANAVAGSMALYPGTHNNGLVPHNMDQPLRPFVEPQHYAGIAPVVLDLPAGDGVLMNPLVLHSSVLNQSERTKFTLMIQVQDYALVLDPEDERGPLAELVRFGAKLTRARATAAG
ncbi:MAG: phytanoyl-CoA dioxygenase family protein [Xanthobacteraceae bacterium]